jgi:threonine dehydrogenase-like Zn-dependent dehydrogenase
VVSVPGREQRIDVASTHRPVDRADHDHVALPDILDGHIEPGRVFDRTVGLDGVPDGYRAMVDRESIKVLVRP